MKPVRLFLFIALFITLGSFHPRYSVANATEKELCEAVKFISQSFVNKEFDKVKGKLEKEDKFYSLVKIKDFTGQHVYEVKDELDDEIVFAAHYHKTFANNNELRKQMNAFTDQLEKCLDQKAKREDEDGEIENFLEIGEQVEVLLTSRQKHPNCIKVEIIYFRD